MVELSPQCVSSESSDAETMRAMSAECEMFMGEAHGLKEANEILDVLEADGEEEGEEEEDDSGLSLDSRFCLNCTARMAADEELCEDCGHAAANDAQLFSCNVNPSNVDAKSSPVALLYDERMELHAEGASAPHPERPDRVRAIVARLLASGLGARCKRVPCREATLSELCSVHTESLVHLVETASATVGTMDSGPGFLLTPDTYVNSHTYMCAKLAAGGAAEVAAMVARGDAQHGAAIVRPPGHHAESGMAMGFCFFNSAAVAARAAQAAGAQRVIVLDWDVHHGNGTQHIFEHDPSVLYMSLHRYDGGSFYPGTGDMTEVGLGKGRGYTVNVPWSTADMGNGDYIAAFNHVIIPVAYEYDPSLIIVSAGFDAADGDPIGECRVTPECFGHMTSMLKAVAPLVLVLEGGYNLQSTAASTEACLQVLLGEQPASLPGPRCASTSGWQVIQDAMRVQSAYWRSLKPAASRDGQGRAAPPAGRQTQQQRPTGSRLLRTDGMLRAPGWQTRTGASRNCRILLKIHRQAMKAFWKRQRRGATQAPV